jgi:hypothetical protein
MRARRGGVWVEGLPRDVAFRSPYGSAPASRCGISGRLTVPHGVVAYGSDEASTRVRVRSRPRVRARRRAYASRGSVGL